ncbi:MAG: hypothetical protein ACYTEG_05845, partial [Planctomycetota bacterium]
SEKQEVQESLHRSISRADPTTTSETLDCGFGFPPISTTNAGRIPDQILGAPAESEETALTRFIAAI